jgi:hypothetical protein
MQTAYADAPTQGAADVLDEGAKTVVVPQSAPWEGILKNSAEALEAQVSIWKLQFMLGVMRAAAAAVGGVLLIALGVYGFVQLDAAAHAAMVPHTPPWVSPLVRGLVYVMIPVALLKPAIEDMFAKEDDKTEGTSNAC